VAHTRHAPVNRALGRRSNCFVQRPERPRARSRTVPYAPMPLRAIILGNGVAGTTAALELRRRDDRAEITLVSSESDYFFSRTGLMYALMGRMSLAELEPHERPAYDRARIRRVRGRATDLDARARTLTLSTGEALSWDALVLATGSVPREIDAHGIKSVPRGVTSFVSLANLAELEALIPSTRHAVVVGGGLIGVELCECLRHHGVSVTCVVRGPWFWPEGLGPEEGALVGRHLRARGVTLREGESLTEVGSDANGRVSSVKLSSGEMISCALLGVAIGVEPNVRWLRGCATPPRIDRGIVTDDRLATSLEGVWAAGDCAEVTTDAGPVIEPLWYAARRQGAFVGRQLSGASERYRPPLLVNSAKFFELEYTSVGPVGAHSEGLSSVLYEHPERAITVRLLHGPEGALQGFCALGSRWDTELLSRWIDERRPMDFVRARLREAQFDHELGRAPLEAMRARQVRS
jgi:NADPH-dependent 2,4-dienoyl-CoA reductase/sulfur reductase-like enzyme